MTDIAQEVPREGSSTLVRAAEWLGRTLGHWRRTRAGRRDDAYIRSWKEAWTEGCEARWQGHDRSALRYKKNPQKDAWMAGWLWADTQPDRRDGSRQANHWHARRRATDRSDTTDTTD